MSEQTTPSKKISVGLILSWIFGVLFALIGIVSVFSEPIPGIVMLIMGAVLLPPVNKLVDEKWKFHLSGGIKAVVLIIGFIIFGSTVDTSKQQSNQPPVQQEQSVSTTEQKKNEIKPTEEQTEIAKDEQQTVTKSDDSSKYINGLAPVDVYLNMEKQGFKTEKQLSGEYGNSWTSTKSYAGIDYRVETYSSNINNVESVQGTAMIDVTQKEIIAAQQFFIFLSSLPYDNADPQKAGQWIKDNYNKDKATTTIGDAKFTMYAPSIALRMIRIEKAE